MDLNPSKEQSSSEDDSLDTYNPEQGLIDGKPVHKTYCTRSQKFYHRYRVFVFLQVLLLVCYAGIFVTWKKYALLHLYHGEHLVYCKFPGVRALQR